MLTGIVSSLRLKDDRQDCERRGRRGSGRAYRSWWYLRPGGRAPLAPLRAELWIRRSSCSTASAIPMTWVRRVRRQTRSPIGTGWSSSRISARWSSLGLPRGDVFGFSRHDARGIPDGRHWGLRRRLEEAAPRQRARRTHAHSSVDKPNARPATWPVCQAGGTIRLCRVSREVRAEAAGRQFAYAA